MPTQTPLEPKNISQIKSTLLHPATTSHFEVRIGLPNGSMNTSLRRFLSGNSQKDLNLMCSEASLPGSQLATTEIFNDFTGATERHAYRRIYDETIDLSFYVDASNYLPIMFFETWMNGIVNEDQNDALSGNYNYRIKYPDDYVATGLKVIKFERTGNPGNDSYGGGQLEYEFVRSYPRSITSMPVSYDGSSLLKVSVQMTYLRYVVHQYPRSAAMRRGTALGQAVNAFNQSKFNANGFLTQAAANLTSQIMSDVNAANGGKFSGEWATSIQLGLGANDQLRSIQSGLA